LQAANIRRDRLSWDENMPVNSGQYYHRHQTIKAGWAGQMLELSLFLLGIYLHAVRTGLNKGAANKFR
jgi:hypothetical protein